MVWLTSLGAVCGEGWLDPECDRTPLEKWGLTPQDQSGDSRQSENA
jgi:hypothetical protein